MSHFDFDAGFIGNFDKNPIQNQDQEQDKVFKTVQLVDEITAVYKNGNSENEEQEVLISVAEENGEDSMQKSRFETEIQAEKQKQEKNRKFVKTGGILILCFLLLNFVLVVIAMNWTSEFSSSSSSSSTSNFSAWKNQTHKTGQIVHKMKFELGGLEKWINSTQEKFKGHHLQIKSLSNQTKIDKKMQALKNDNLHLKKSQAELTEQFESLSQKIDQLERRVSLPTPPVENEDQGLVEPQSITSCSVAMETLTPSRSNKQEIHPYGNAKSLEVLCEFETDGGGWTIIQKRSSGPREEFDRNWDEYVNGFGSLDKNFWLGLENIHALTQNGDQELRIQLEDFEGEKRWAKYSNFSISDASDFYRLSISGYSEDSNSNLTAGDSMTNPEHGAAHTNNAMRFSTRDEDHDKNRHAKCAELSGGGGWWFNECGASNLNGLYHGKGEIVRAWKGIYWDSWKEEFYSLAKSEMKIRKRK